MLPTLVRCTGQHALSFLYLASPTIRHCPPKHCYHCIYIYIDLQHTSQTFSLQQQQLTSPPLTLQLTPNPIPQKKKLW